MKLLQNIKLVLVRFRLSKLPSDKQSELVKQLEDKQKKVMVAEKRKNALEKH